MSYNVPAFQTFYTSFIDISIRICLENYLEPLTIKVIVSKKLAFLRF